MSKSKNRLLSSINYDSTSSEETDTEQFDGRQKSTRKTVKPSYFGMVGQVDFSSSTSSQDPFESDDILDVYLPSPKRQKKTVVFSTNANLLRKKNSGKKNAQKSSAWSRTAQTTTSAYNFDDYFNMLDRAAIDESKLAAPECSTPSTSSGYSHAADVASHSGSSGQENGVIEENSQSNVEHTGPAKSEIMHDTDAFEFLQNMNMKLNEIISRIVTMENTMHAITVNSYAKEEKSAHLRRVRDELCAEAELFMKSNALPTQNVEDLNRFEKNLNDPVFYTAAVSISNIFAPKMVYLCVIR